MSKRVGPRHWSGKGPSGKWLIYLVLVCSFAALGLFVGVTAASATPTVDTPAQERPAMSDLVPTLVVAAMCVTTYVVVRRRSK